MTTTSGKVEHGNGAAPLLADLSAAKLAHIEQLSRILTDQRETCLQLAACAQEQQDALRLGRGSDFVRASLTQAHLARRFYFLEEERTVAIETLAQALSADAGPTDLSSILENLPEGQAERLSARSQELRKSAEKVTAIQRVNAQMIQTNLQLAAALTRHRVDPTAHYGTQPQPNKLPASQLDQRI
jgi:hypothetical protein